MTQLSVRLPDDLHARLKAIAKADHRSLNSEIVVLLEQAVKNVHGDSPSP